jgi:arylsulfatase A-like enzyme
MVRLSRRSALRLLAGAAVGWPARRLKAQGRSWTPRNAPNFVVIMTDDQRADAFSAAGNPILRTPNIDRIADEGVRFTEAFVVNSLCAPSRASFLTGLYAHAHGVLTNGSGEVFRNQPGLRENQLTFVHLLRQAGYQTGLVGKWHLRSSPDGFDHWVILPGGGGPYNDPEMTANGTGVKMRGYSDDVVGDQALEYLENRSKDRPFCLLYNFKAPHRNWIPAPRHQKAFEDIEVPTPRTFEDKFEGRPEALRRTDMAIADMPDFKDRGVPESLPREERKRLNLQHLVKNYYRTILSVDDNIGRVLEYLDKNDLAKDTVVMFSSDNGFFLGEHGFYDKRLMYEPSIRVPMLIRYPSRVQPRVDSEHLVLNVDAAPTLLELAGIPVPASLQGRSVMPLIDGRTPLPDWRSDFYYEFFEHPDADHCVRKNRGVRTKRWKLIQFWEQPEEWELYDLATDPDETRNLFKNPNSAARVRELRARMTELRRQLGDADPPGPPPHALPCEDR